MVHREPTCCHSPAPTPFADSVSAVSRHGVGPPAEGSARESAGPLLSKAHLLAGGQTGLPSGAEAVWDVWGHGQHTDHVLPTVCVQDPAFQWQRRFTRPVSR